MTLSKEDYNRHKAIFEALDVNHDGTITLAEMEKVLNSRGIECKTEDLMKLVDNADKDNNSSISWNEYLALVIKIKQQTEQRIKDKLDKEAWLAFELADQNKDGVIDYEEFVVLFQKLKDVEQDPTKLRELFDAADADKDGSINFEEFKKLLE